MSNLSLLQFRSRLFLIVGALPVLACGGKVRFNDGDGDGGAGGDGGNGGSGGSTSSVVITGGGGWCADTAGLDYLCFESDTCPGFTTPQAAANIEAALVDECSQSGCGCTARVDFLACGPDPSAEDGCCYYGVATIEDEFCEGRPFLVEGETRTATLAARGDWSAACPLDLLALTDAERVALAERWEESALFEHASVASFSRFLMELLGLGAPASLVREAATALRDEVRHAELCFGIASALRGEAVGPGALDVGAGATPRATAEEIVYAAAREGCVGETLSALVAQAACDVATEPSVRAALQEIVADELRHAELAWRFVAWACANDAPGSALEGARAGALRGFAAAPSFEEADLPEGLRPEVARAFGFLSRSERRAHAKRALAVVIAPARDALFADAARTPPGDGLQARSSLVAS
jgi:hypothetical protein